MSRTADTLKRSIAPAPEEEKTEVDSVTMQRLAQARAVTGACASVTLTLMQAVTAAARSFGSTVADAFSNTEVGQSVARSVATTEAGIAVKTVAMSSITAAGTLFVGLEEAAKVLFTGTHAAAREVAHHRYGEDVAAAVAASLDVAGDLTRTAWNMRLMGSGAVLRATTTGAGML